MAALAFAAELAAPADNSAFAYSPAQSKQVVARIAVAFEASPLTAAFALAFVAAGAAPDAAVEAAVAENAVELAAALGVELVVALAVEFAIESKKL